MKKYFKILKYFKTYIHLQDDMDCKLNSDLLLFPPVLQMNLTRMAGFVL